MTVMMRSSTLRFLSLWSNRRCRGRVYDDGFTGDVTFSQRPERLVDFRQRPGGYWGRPHLATSYKPKYLFEVDAATRTYTF